MIGGSYQQEQTYTRTELLQTAAELAEMLERESNLLPYHYSYQIGDGKRFGRGSVGAMSFQINGRRHVIRAGASVCYLQEIGPDGTGRVVNTIDIRDRERVDTDDLGPIKVCRRKLKVTLFQTIPILVSFLRASKDEAFRVLTTDGKPSLLDLVRLVEEGSGADDWAEEQLQAMGQKGRTALIAKLGDPKAKKHYVAIARLLLTLFRSRESRQAVEELLKQDQDRERKAAYLLWLASTQQD
jgi:hypothetical protein